jgi:DNA-binding transcriptional MocR family regulator
MAIVSARQLDILLQGWRGSGTAYVSLADRIRLLVLDGRLPAGSRLPAERLLAERLGVSRTTVSAAYANLRDGGLLVSTQGSGSVTRLPPRTPGAVPSDPADGVDLRKAALPAAPALAAAALRAAHELPAYLGGTGFDPVGLPQLRAAIAARYAARGLPTTADQVMVTVGAQHAIALLARVLVERGDRVLVESPSYPHAYEALRAAGGRLVPISVSTADGWDIDALEHSVRRSSPSLAYLMPDFHNPTGQSMAPEARARVLAVAEEHGTVVVADETMAELAIDGPGLRLPLAASGPAVLVDSLAKTVWGGIRIGWIRAEAPLLQRLAAARLAIDLGTPILEQLIATDLLGRYDEILAGRRELLRRGRDHLEQALAESFPDWLVPHVGGGLTTWVNLGAPLSSELVLAARAEGLLLAAGPLFGLDGAFERFLRIPFTMTPEQTDVTVAALRRAWGSLSAYPAVARNTLAGVV